MTRGNPTLQMRRRAAKTKHDLEDLVNLLMLKEGVTRKQALERVRAAGH